MNRFIDFGKPFFTRPFSKHDDPFFLNIAGSTMGCMYQTALQSWQTLPRVLSEPPVEEGPLYSMVDCTLFSVIVPSHGTQIWNTPETQNSFLSFPTQQTRNNGLLNTYQLQLQLFEGGFVVFYNSFHPLEWRFLEERSLSGLAHNL